MEKENLLTEKDLLVLSACTGCLFIKDFNKLHGFIEETLGRSVQTLELALQDTADACKEKLKDKYLAVLNKMVAQTEVSQCQI